MRSSPSSLSALLISALLLSPATLYAAPTPSTKTSAAPSQAQKPSSLEAQLVESAKKSVDKGIHFLKGQQSSDGSYGSHVGLTAMTLIAMAESYRVYREDDGPFVSRAAEWLAGQARADGAISGDATPTYNTALAIMALHALDPIKYKTQIEGGQRFLVHFQTDEDHHYKRKDKHYGGIGYGGDERPDLSNLQYALEGLKRTNYDPNSDVWAKAELFIKRCQNYTEDADQDELKRPWATNDGGFTYEPSAGAKGTASYGAMTFAGLKSLMFTRESNRDDPRVKAAWGWIQRNYDFNTHPGVGSTAYYYYLQTAASALEAYGEALVPSKDAQKSAEGRRWAADLLSKLSYLQREDGSWKNDDRKYWEGNPLLVTARAVISMNHALRASGAQ